MFTASDLRLQYPPLPTIDKKWKTNVELAPNCPRCASSNTKFCYYNNYSLSQPRYFCKGCRRYWTKGGSLRNVPVGGGCRKNRRSKSRRLSESYSSNFSSLDDNTNDVQTGVNSCSSDGDSVGQSNGRSDIDLAVVFAKFLNESSSSDHQPDQFVCQESGDGSNSLTPDSVQDDGMMGCHKQSDHSVGEPNLLEAYLIGEKQQEEEKNIQDFLENDTTAFGLENLLSDEVVQDVLWSNDATLTNFTWQSVFQLQESFDSLIPATDDQLMTSANLISDNWSSFEMSGFEVYSRP